MAKETMICPFSNRLCKECALYRARHYYLCFCHEYRGALGRGDASTQSHLTSGPTLRDIAEFRMPDTLPSAIDPFISKRK